MDVSHVLQTAGPLLTAFALKVLGAIVIWLIARAVIAFVARLVVRSLKYPFDQTVAGYIGTAVSVLLRWLRTTARCSASIPTTRRARGSSATWPRAGWCRGPS